MPTARKQIPHADPYMTVAAAAKALGISRPTVYAWATKGDLETVMIAERLVVVRASVEARQRAQSAAVAA